MRISTDRLSSFSALLIGLATLVTVVYQAQRWPVSSHRVVPEHA